MSNKKVTILVQDFEEFRDSINQTGVFEMSDCNIEIFCNTGRSIKEIQKIIDFTSSAINVIESSVISSEDEDENTYTIVISEIIPPYMRAPERRKRTN